MLTLEIRFLTGRYVATRFNDRSRSEWPPHPARVFSALTAALHDDPEHTEAERDALDWLALASAPEILYPEGRLRLQPEVYVPPNDDSALANIDRYIMELETTEESLAEASGPSLSKAERAAQKARRKLLDRSQKSAMDDGRGTPSNAARVLAAGRQRQPRTFPTILPVAEVVLMYWTDTPSASVADALDRVASRVARLGHSSSLVSLRFTAGDDPPVRTAGVHIAPDAKGDQVLRVAAPGQLARLEEAHSRHRQVHPRVLPAVFETYGPADGTTSEDDGTPSSDFDDRGWLVFEVVAPPTGGRRILMNASLAQYVARAMRGLILAHAADGDLPASISGHAEDGRPTDRAHVAYVPLAHVGHYHASGSILGLAVVPPRDLSREDRGTLLSAIARAEQAARVPDDEAGDVPTLQLTLGRRGVLHLRRLRDVSERQTLRPARWTRSAARWATATPIALDRNPGDLRSGEPVRLEEAVARAEATIADACVNIGLPAPAAVWLHRRSVVDGAPAARRFMPFPDGGSGPKRVCVHAEIAFYRFVRGPMLLGAGRYHGLGLCIPKDN